MNNFSNAYDFPSTSKLESSASLSPFSDDGGKPTSRQILNHLTGMVDAADEENTSKNISSVNGNYSRYNQNFQSNINALNNLNSFNSSNISSIINSNNNSNNNNSTAPIFK